MDSNKLLGDELRLVHHLLKLRVLEVLDSLKEFLEISLESSDGGGKSLQLF